jgi:hypothetical protein
MAFEAQRGFLADVPGPTVKFCGYALRRAKHEHEHRSLGTSARCVRRTRQNGRYPLFPRAMLNAFRPCLPTRVMQAHARLVETILPS